MHVVKRLPAVNRAAEAPAVLLAAHAVAQRKPWLLGGLLVLGAVLALALGSIGERQALGGTRGSWLIAEVNRERSFSQSFNLGRDGLAGVQLQLFRSGLNRDLDDAEVVVRLRSSLRPGPDLASAALRLRDLNPHGPSEFRFASFSPIFPTRLVSTTLYILVEAPSLAPGSGLMIAGTSDNYYDGVLRIGSKRFTRFDLAFTPVYRSLLGDRVMPLSRMAQGKPGLLGWPPFYPLLFYAFVLAAGWALWQLRLALR